jgi:hypothetical protein
VRPNYIDEDHWSRLMALRQMILSENQPIEFYARTIDQDGQPVSGAILIITISRVDERLFNTTNFFHLNAGDEIIHHDLQLVSDIDGWMRLTNTTGNSLWFEAINKSGYTCELPNVGSFLFEPNGQHRVGYAGMEDAFDPARGYVFHLQKIEK